MGKRSNRAGRNTRELDAGQLAALTKQAKEGTHEQPVGIRRNPTDHPFHALDRASTDDAFQAVALGRTATLDDPFTTGLLAEVARRSQTLEFDEDLIEEIQALSETAASKKG